MPVIKKDGTEANGAKARVKIQLILQLLSKGTPLKQAASEVGWAYQTARNALQIYRKDIGASNIQHAIAMFIKDQRNSVILPSKTMPQVSDGEVTCKPGEGQTRRSREVPASHVSNPKEQTYEKDDYSQ